MVFLLSKRFLVLPDLRSGLTGRSKQSERSGRSGRSERSKQYVTSPFVNKALPLDHGLGARSRDWKELGGLTRKSARRIPCTGRDFAAESTSESFLLRRESPFLPRDRLGNYSICSPKASPPFWPRLDLDECSGSLKGWKRQSRSTPPCSDLGKGNPHSVLLVEEDCIHHVELLHHFPDRNVRGFYLQMDMVRHQTVRENTATVVSLGPQQILQVYLPVHIILEDLLASIAPTHDMIRRTWVPNSWFAGH